MPRLPTSVLARRTAEQNPIPLTRKKIFTPVTFANNGGIHI
jgi:hypothetical protein